MPSSNSPSTGVADRVVQVEVRKSSSFAVCAFGPTWLKILYDQEAVLLMDLSIHTMSFSTLQEQTTSPIITSDPLPATPTSSGNTPSHVPSSTSSISRTQQDATTPSTVQVKSDSVSLPSGYVPPLGVFKHALQKGQLEVLRQHFENSWSLYLTDTGGQMEFQELFPLLVSGPSIFFFTFRLDQGLNQRFTIEYRLPDGGRSDPYQSTLTVKEALLQTLASVASMGTFTYKGPQIESVPLKPKVMIVGTHKDRLDKATAELKIKEIDDYLQNVIKSTSHYREDLVEFASETRLIYTVNNFSEDVSNFQDIRTGVERAVHRGQFKMSFPSHWLIFSFVLRQQMFEERIISYEQCFTIAQDCGIADQEELDHALWFLHTKIGLIRHFPAPGLREIVIRDPQILFDKVTHLILNTFTFKNVGKRPSDEFKKKGIFRFEDFERVSAITDPSLKSLISNPFTPEKLVLLLEHLRIVAPFEDENGQTKYFLPCVLAHSEVCKSPSLPQSSDIPPLLITFKCGYCPKGLYGSLLKYLLVNEMRSKFKWELKTDQIFRDQVSFLVSPYDFLTLKFHSTFLELIHSCVPLPNANGLVESVCNEVRQSVEKGVRKISSDLNFTSDAKHSLSFYCQNADCVRQIKGPHPATEVKFVGTRTCALWCRRSGSIVVSTPLDGCSVWLGQESQTRDGCHSNTTVAAPPTSRSRTRDDDNAESVDSDLLSGDPKRPRISSPPSSSDSGGGCLNTMSNSPAFHSLNTSDSGNPSSHQQGSIPKLAEAFRTLLPMASEWQDIAVLLGIPNSMVKVIREDNTRVKACLRELLTEWLNQVDPPPSWNTLADAVGSLGNQTIAREIREKYLS